MGRMPWATHLWPGLPQICRDGRWTGLVAALGFAALVDLALMASLLWSELVAAGVRSSVWMAVAVIWLGSTLLSYRRDSRYSTHLEAKSSQVAFAEAVDRYLKGDWFESERALRRLIGEDPRDLDAGLMLASLLRRTGRPDEAASQLARLERLAGCEKWELEIRREYELLRAEWEEENAQHAGTEEDGGGSASPAELADAA
jgi:hypothetical protein